MQKPSIIKRIFIFLFRLAVIAALMVAIAVISFEGVTWYLTKEVYDLRNVLKSGGSETADNDNNILPKKEEEEVDDSNMKNVLFFVEGEDGLSRYSALVMMNKETKATDILLIPLHVQVTVGGKLLTEIQSHIPNAASTVELDDIARVYGDDRYRIISDIFSEIFGVKIAGYDAVTQDKFEEMLNIAGKVKYQFDNMLSYRTNKQVLKCFESGEHNLDGAEAVIVMSHMDGTDKQESDRLERCNTYLESWTDEILSSGKGGQVIDFIQANAASSQGRDFTQEKEIWSSLTSDALTLRILQGAESQGVFTIDSQKAKLQIATLAKQSEEYDSSHDKDSVEEIKEDDQETVASSKEYYIELYNAAFRSGLASEWESFLEEEGYNISLIDSYQDEGPLSTTRIIVNQEGIGQDLLKYFPDASIETDDIETGGDIQIYIGTDSINVGKSESDSSDESEDEDDSDDDKKDEKKKDKKKDNKDSEDNEEDDDTEVDYYKFDKESE
jgi:anionic cell wall polymer biosynthesis LytR-Cps2A-Psr (LCP) family protein